MCTIPGIPIRMSVDNRSQGGEGWCVTKPFFASSSSFFSPTAIRFPEGTTLNSFISTAAAVTPWHGTFLSRRDRTRAEISFISEFKGINRSVITNREVAFWILKFCSVLLQRSRNDTLEVFLWLLSFIRSIFSVFLDFSNSIFFLPFLPFPFFVFVFYAFWVIYQWMEGSLLAVKWVRCGRKSTWPVPRCCLKTILSNWVLSSAGRIAHSKYLEFEDCWSAYRDFLFAYCFCIKPRSCFSGMVRYVRLYVVSYSSPNSALSYIPVG